MSTTALQAMAAIRARLEADDAGISIPLRWHGEDSPPLPDAPMAFGFVVFNNQGSGGAPIEFGGGAGRNRWRNRAVVEAYVFVPNSAGLTAAMEHAETIAGRLRSFRDSAVSCFSADVIPIGAGASVSPPGVKSEVAHYQSAVCEVTLHFDQVG